VGFNAIDAENYTLRGYREDRDGGWHGQGPDIEDALLDPDVFISVKDVKELFAEAAAKREQAARRVSRSTIY